MKTKKVKIKQLRLNEAGDFRDQEQVRQWNRIAGRLKREHGITTYTYTARNDLDFSRAPNLIVNASNPGTRGACRRFICTEGKVFDKLELGSNEAKCPGDCTICNLCSTRNRIKRIYCRRH